MLAIDEIEENRVYENKKMRWKKGPKANQLHD